VKKVRVYASAPGFEIRVLPLSNQEAKTFNKFGIDGLTAESSEDLDLRLDDAKLFSGHLLYDGMNPLVLTDDEDTVQLSQHQLLNDYVCELLPVFDATVLFAKSDCLVQRIWYERSVYSTLVRGKRTFADLRLTVYRYRLGDSYFLNPTYKINDETFEFDRDSGIDKETFTLVPCGLRKR
jgi:hypothetical protein